MRRRYIYVLLVLSAVSAQAQEAKQEDIEAERIKLLTRWGVEGLVRPVEIEAEAKILFARPLSEQSEDELQRIAKQANAGANFVGFILEEYQDYYRDNYKYDFVQKKVAPFHDTYVKISNLLKKYRNQAYFNLGKKAVERGDEITAFFMFRDAYRLSGFTEEEGDHKGLRYHAETEMKKLLGLEGVASYTYWK